MPIQDEVLEEYARPYYRRAEALDGRGETQKACAFRIVGAALELLPKWRKYSAPQGTYFGQIRTGAFGDAPDMSLFERADAVTTLRTRALRTRDLDRRARLADVAWEFGGHADAARTAIDAYERLGTAAVTSQLEHVPMHGAAALARALVLARAISDAALATRVAAAVSSALMHLRNVDEHVALFILVEVALATRADEDVLQVADEALETHQMRLAPRDEDNFNFQRAVLALRRALAARRGDAAGVTAFDREIAEAIVREAEWKGKNYENGALVEMHFLEEAAQKFEALGDVARATELRKRQRGTFPRAQFQKLEHTVQLEAGPFHEWLGRMLAPSADRAQIWPEIVRALPVTSQAEIAAMRADEARELPVLALAGVITATPDGVTEVVPAEEASRRRARHFAFEYDGLKVALLVKLATEKHDVKVSDAVRPLVATGRFDDTSRELLERVCAAYDAHDWLTVGYLAGPLVERLTRHLATMLGLETMRTDRHAGGKNVRRLFVAPEDHLARLPLNDDLRDYLLWVVGHPGLNLRNAVAHGILGKDQCHEVLGAHVLYAIIALAFADLAAVSA